MRRSNPADNLLPHSLAGRVALGLLSAVFLPPAAFVLFALTFGRPAATWGEWLLRVAVWEFFAALFAVSVCGLLWAVATPSWLPRYAEYSARQLTLLGLIPFLVLLGWYLWPL